MPEKREVARALEEIGRLLQIEEKNRFKSVAYLNASRKVESLQMPMQEFVDSGAIHRTPGIGKATGHVIEEFVRTGRSTYLEELRARYPAGIFELLRVPGLGLRKIGILHKELGISNLEELDAAVSENRLVTLKGFGARTQQKIGQGIAIARMHRSEFLLPNAIRVADALRRELESVAGVSSVVVAGSIRRRLEVVRNINFLAVCPDVGRATESITAAGILSDVERVDDRTVRGHAGTGIEVLFHACLPEELPTSLLFLSGSSAFVDALVAYAKRRDFALTADGLRKAGRRVAVESEEEVFRTIGAHSFEPEIREQPPKSFRPTKRRLVDVPDLRGTFHVHSTFSDGRATIYEMLDAASDRGYAYLGLSDHSPTAYYARGLTVDRLEEQHTEIEKHRRAFESMRIFRGTESDILPDGSLDYPPEILAKLDFVVASIHSRFKMTPEEMTRRIIGALRNPFTTFLGHLTGRLLLSREGYSMDFDAVFAEAARNEVFIEINGNPHRLDVDWRRMQRALSLGVHFSIHPDAHSVAEMNHIVTGVWNARKGGLAPEDIFNTRSVEEVEEHLRNRRERALKVQSDE